MSEAKFSMSKSALLSHCAHWVGKECGERLDDSSSSHGTLVHEAIHKCLSSGGYHLYPEGGPYSDEVYQASVYVEEVLGGITATEVQFDVNTKDWTVTVKEFSDGRDYGDLPGHLYGTADVVKVELDKSTVHVLDWKTGRGTGALEQLKSLGGAAALYYGVENVVLHAVHVEASKHYPIGVWTFSASALREHLLDVSFNLGIPKAIPDPGPHCSELYCPYADRCPGLNGSLPVALQEPLEAPRNAIDVARLVPALLSKKKRLEAVLDACKEIARKDDVSDGAKVWRETFQNRQSVDKDGLVALARRLGATDADLEPLVKLSRSSGGFKWTNKKAGE